MRFFTFVALFFLLAGNSYSQNYPLKPPKIVVGFPPGGSGDFTTRIIADELSKELGVAIVVENKPGAGGAIAAEYVAKAAADGYTVLNHGHHAYNRVMYKDLAYSDKDFIPVSRVANGATILVINANSPFQSLQDLLAFARANPGKLFNASAGFGSAPHVAACVFEAVAGVRITSVQFKGGGPAAQSLLAGDTQMMFATSPTVTGFIQAGRMKPFLVSVAKGSPSIPNIPGGDAAGVPGFQSTFWFGLYVPAGTSQAIVRRLHAAAAKGLSKPEVREKIALQGMDAAPSASPEAFADEIRTEAPDIERALRGCGAKIE